MRSVVSLHNALPDYIVSDLAIAISELALLTTPNSYHLQILLNCTFSERLRPPWAPHFQRYAQYAILSYPPRSRQSGGEDIE
jgi:hypothetical protein